MKFVLIKRGDLSQTLTIGDVVCATVYMSNKGGWLQLVDSYGGVHRYPLCDYFFQVDKSTVLDNVVEDNDDWG